MKAPVIVAERIASARLFDNFLNMVTIILGVDSPLGLKLLFVLEFKKR
jgi:hypothetical protein